MNVIFGLWVPHFVITLFKWMAHTQGKRRERESEEKSKRHTLQNSDSYLESVTAWKTGREWKKRRIKWFGAHIMTTLCIRDANAYSFDRFGKRRKSRHFYSKLPLSYDEPKQEKTILCERMLEKEDRKQQIEIKAATEAPKWVEHGWIVWYIRIIHPFYSCDIHTFFLFYFILFHLIFVVT